MHQIFTFIELTVCINSRQSIISIKTDKRGWNTQAACWFTSNSEAFRGTGSLSAKVHALHVSQQAANCAATKRILRTKLGSTMIYTVCFQQTVVRSLSKSSAIITKRFASQGVGNNVPSHRPFSIGLRRSEGPPDTRTRSSVQYSRPSIRNTHRIRGISTKEGNPISDHGINIDFGKSKTSALQSKPFAMEKVTHGASLTEREPWQIQKDGLTKKFKGVAWAPRKKLSPDALDGVRALHAADPVKHSTASLAKQFEISPDAIRRILKSKWRASETEQEDRQQRWNDMPRWA